MKAVIASMRQAHYRLPANAFIKHTYETVFYSSTPKNRFRGLDAEVKHRFLPIPPVLLNAITGRTPSTRRAEQYSVMFDRLASWRLEECEIVVGAASSSLYIGQAVQKRGGRFVLDRACPDIRVQEQMISVEAVKVGGTFERHSEAFRERQIAEYECADAILCPSHYSRNSFPDHLKSKIVIAPLFGRALVATTVPRQRYASFTLGVVGGDPLRKGYWYLLQAWKELKLPNARLRLRASGDFSKYPLLAKLLAEQTNVAIVPYVKEISSFYAECDAFILPSVDDGFGMALFEALGNGVPSVVTRNCGASELLVDGRDALIIDAFNVVQIKEALQLLYESQETRERLRLNGPEAVLKLQEGGEARPYNAGFSELLTRIRG